MAAEGQVPGVNCTLVPVSPLCMLLAREAASPGRAVRRGMGRDLGCRVPVSRERCDRHPPEHS
jgi:hypothetical protein